MRILAIECTLNGGSVALVHGEEPVAAVQLDPGRRTAQTLLPAIQRLLLEAGWQPREVALVAVTRGPGSFTGLRIGITAARCFAYATGAGVLGIDSLAVLAAQVPCRPVAAVSAADAARYSSGLWSILDAERGQLFAARFRPGWSGWLEDVPPHILHADQWLRGLEPATCVTGPALERLRDRLPVHVSAAPPTAWTPQAVTVGQLAARWHRQGQRGNVWSLAPRYLRPSAAEEQMLAAKVLAARHEDAAARAEEHPQGPGTQGEAPGTVGRR
jgi:tRNA threonylcarbamoyladenosine biosynthesis protein TsaB